LLNNDDAEMATAYLEMDAPQGGANHHKQLALVLSRKGSSAKTPPIEAPSFAPFKDAAAARSDLNWKTGYRR
jgi:hypothetical protein